MALLKYWDDGAGEWKTVIGSVGQADGNIVELMRHDVTGNETQIDLTDIPAGFDDLILDSYLITDRDSSSGLDRVSIQLGGGSLDTGSNYSWKEIVTGGVLGSEAVTHAGAQNDTLMRLGSFASAANYSEMSHWARAVIRQYSNTNIYRTVHTNSGGAMNSGGADGTALWMSEAVGTWRNKAAAIQQIRLKPVVGTNFTGGFVILLGVKAGAYNA